MLVLESRSMALGLSSAAYEPFLSVSMPLPPHKHPTLLRASSPPREEKPFEAFQPKRYKKQIENKSITMK